MQVIHYHHKLLTKQTFWYECAQLTFFVGFQPFFSPGQLFLRFFFLILHLEYDDRKLIEIRVQSNGCVAQAIATFNAVHVLNAIARDSKRKLTIPSKICAMHILVFHRHIATQPHSLAMVYTFYYCRFATIFFSLIMPLHALILCKYTICEASSSTDADFKCLEAAGEKKIISTRKTLFFLQNQTNKKKIGVVDVITLQGGKKRRSKKKETK